MSVSPPESLSPRLSLDKKSPSRYCLLPYRNERTSSRTHRVWRPETLMSSLQRTLDPTRLFVRGLAEVVVIGALWRIGETETPTRTATKKVRNYVAMRS